MSSVPRPPREPLRPWSVAVVRDKSLICGSRPYGTTVVHLDKLRDAEVGSSNLPHPTIKDQVRGGFRCCEPPACNLSFQPACSEQLLLRGHAQFKAATRLAAHRQRQRPRHGQAKADLRDRPRPEQQAGAAKADSELAKLVAQVETGRTMPTSGMTVAQLIDCYIDDRSPSWASGAAEETRARVAQHITPDLGSITIERLRPVDVQQLHSQLRAGGLSEGSIGRVHDILWAALSWADRLDLIVRNPAAKVERLRGVKPGISPPTPAEVVRMITEASEPLALSIRLDAVTGARRGQLCGLRWSDIDRHPCLRPPIDTWMAPSLPRTRVLDRATCRLRRVSTVYIVRRGRSHAGLSRCSSMGAGPSRSSGRARR